MLPIDTHIFATGDDGGAVKVWDLRRGSAILEARQQEEYISAMAVDGNGKILLTARYWRGSCSWGRAPHVHSWLGCPGPCPVLTACPFTSHSGDGTLGVFNVKRRRFELLSEPQNGDLTSVVLMKVGTAPPTWSRIPQPPILTQFFVLLCLPALPGA